MAQAGLQPVDHTGLKVGTATTILLLAVAFVLDSWLLVVLVALCQVCSGLGVGFAPYRLLYQHIIKPSGIIAPHILQDHREPHQFAMLLGAIFNGIGAVILAAGISTGWVLVGIVFVLANLQLWLNFCAGCWMYYQFNRFGIAGFSRSAPDGQQGEGGDV